MRARGALGVAGIGAEFEAPADRAFGDPGAAQAVVRGAVARTGPRPPLLSRPSRGFRARGAAARLRRGQAGRPHRRASAWRPGSPKDWRRGTAGRRCPACSAVGGFTETPPSTRQL
ncbi:hypothetical protein ACRAWD_15685 [Caulobacter segnis]